MRIECVEVQNFRKLRSTRIDFDREQTLFVGANNSGKTSAMLALRYFLIDRTAFSYRDVSVTNWHAINQLGEAWEKLRDDEEISVDELLRLLPAIDIWLHVRDSEIHHVAHLLPSLDWTGGSLGVRMRLEPKNIKKLFTDYRGAREKARTTVAQAEKNGGSRLSVWPENLLEYLDKRMRALVTVNSYVLDPDKREQPRNGVARPQPLPARRMPLDRDPWQGLIRIDEIAAQRNLSDASSSYRSSDDTEGATRSRRRLSEQLREYYNRHLDPAKSPTEADIDALIAIQSAEQTFDVRLKEHFDEPIKELESLGYPGIADPKVTINTRFRPTDGLQHASAVQYEVVAGGSGIPLRLPEDYSGLGYQNLISMVFMLMSFRDDWMQVGKRAQRDTGDDERLSVPPLHLVLVEEPEAHLHAQVQQVFIKKAYELLRKHPDLTDPDSLATQLVVSTHSSHIAHEVDFKCLRYFRRSPVTAGTDASTTTVANLSTLFGTGDATQRFVSRYLKSTHCDLFFADAAILVEGQAERILVPHFIRHRYKDLDRRYITLLEIGGAHAHRFKPLIEALGLTTLIVADVDAVILADGHWRAAAPRIGTRQKTSNEVLKSWHPGTDDLDTLMQLQTSRHECRVDGQPVIYVAFQKPIEVVQVGAVITIIPRTFEDAFVYANQTIVASMGEEPLTKKIAALVSRFKEQPEALAEELFQLLKKAEKATFALDILMHDPPHDIVPPAYIAQGLAWLDRELAQSTTSGAPQTAAVVSKRASL